MFTHKYCYYLDRVSWSFSDWFTVFEGDKLLVSTLFTYACRPDNAKCIAIIRSDNILFRDVIQSQANKKIMTEIFEQAENEDNTKYTI